MPRPIQALIHTDAFAHNLRRARELANGAKVWTVVKADAYGHGLELAYEGLKGADGLALLDVAEAERVRRLGWRKPVLLLEGAFEPRDLEACSRLHLAHVVHRAEQIDWIAAHKTDKPHVVFLKLNSGMNRLGFAPAAFGTAWQRLNALPQVEEIVLMSHFADAEGERGIAHPMAVFDEATRSLPGQRSLANSAALLRHGAEERGPSGENRVTADWVRAGIMSYGSSPDFPAHDIAHWDLRPTMTLRTQLIATQTLRAGDSVGYGSTFVADAALPIGIAACGYADGYPRHCGTGTPVLVDGVRTRTLGRVSMDMVAVDLAAVRGAGPGSEVTLWGCGPNGSVLSIDEVAHAAGTVGYDLMCGLARRVPIKLA